MSIYDFLYSLAKAWTFLLTPRAGQPGAMGVPGALGNMATCRLQGFFIETAHATGAYNSLLSIYFWLSICRGVKNERWEKFEPFAHALLSASQSLESQLNSSIQRLAFVSLRVIPRAANRHLVLPHVNDDHRIPWG